MKTKKKKFKCWAIFKNGKLAMTAGDTSMPLVFPTLEVAERVFGKFKTAGEKSIKIVELEEVYG